MKIETEEQYKRILGILAKYKHQRAKILEKTRYDLWEKVFLETYNEQIEDLEEEVAIYMNKLLPLQSKMLSSKKRVTIVAVGCGAGASYGLGLKALASKDKTVTVLLPTVKQATVALNTFVDNFGDYLDKESKCTLSVKSKKGTEIFFQGADLMMWIKSPLVLIESPQYFDRSHLETLLELEDIDQFILVTKPFECGWRNPLYKNGIRQKDSEGGLAYDKYSWDKSLLNWGNSRGIKAHVSQYKDYVEVITDFGLEDNEFLVESNPCYVDAVNALPDEDRYRLQGGWVL